MDTHNSTYGATAVWTNGGSAIDIDELDEHYEFGSATWDENFEVVTFSHSLAAPDRLGTTWTGA